MTKMVTKLAAFALVLFTMALAPSAKADEWDKKTVFTTNHSIQIQNKVLEPGQYVMKLLDSPSDRHILQIFNAAETKLEMTIMASSAYRLQPTGDTRLTFSEMENGQPAVLHTWFYPGDYSGLDFSFQR